jgi:hypothetical protein
MSAYIGLNRPTDVEARALTLTLILTLSTSLADCLLNLADTSNKSIGGSCHRVRVFEGALRRR